MEGVFFRAAVRSLSAMPSLSAALILPVSPPSRRLGYRSLLCFLACIVLPAACIVPPAACAAPSPLPPVQRTEKDRA